MTTTIETLNEKIARLEARLEKGWDILEVQKHDRPDREFQVNAWLDLLRQYEAACEERRQLPDFLQLLFSRAGYGFSRKDITMTVQLKKSFGNQPRQAAVEDGLYKVKLVQISEPKMYPGFNGEGEVEKCRFVFEITRDYAADEHEQDYTGEELSCLVNINATGERSTQYKIVRAIMQQNPEELGEFDLYEMMHQECKVSVSVKFSEDGKSSYANITEFMPLKPLNTASGNGNGKPAGNGKAPAQPPKDDKPLF